MTATLTRIPEVPKRNPSIYVCEVRPLTTPDLHSDSSLRSFVGCNLSEEPKHQDINSIVCTMRKLSIFSNKFKNHIKYPSKYHH